jgi:hypothetical protein
MPGQGVVQASFTSGELSPSLYGRVDFAKYYTALKTCRNFIVRQYGGVSNRPGTRYIATPKYSGTKAIKLIPFQFSTIQTYVLEFGDYYMRVIMNGGYVLSGGNPVEIVTIYPESSLALLKYTQSYDVMTLTHPDYPPQQLSRTSHTAWALAPFNNVKGPFKDINADKSKTVTVSGQTGAVTVTANADIFTTDMVGLMLYIEADPNAQAASAKKWEVSKSITINDIRRAGSNYYLAIGSGTTGTVRPTTLDGFEYDGDPGVPWQYQHSGNGIVLITGFADARHVSGTVMTMLPETLVNSTLATAITGAVAGTVKVTITCVGHGLASGELVTIVGVVGMTDLNGSWTVTVVDATTFTVALSTVQTYTSGGTASRTLTATASYKWALEAWGSADAYPGTVSYFQQRQVFAGSSGRPQTFWLSTTGGYADYSVSVPVADNDAANYTLASREVNEIRHAVDLTKLLLFTSGGIWVVAGNSDGVITPSTINVRKQVNDGAGHLPPLVIGSEALYVLDKGNQIKSVGYSWQKDTYVGNDLAIMSSHLFEGHSIVSWAFQKTPFSCVWAVRDDGVLLCLTYLPEQEVVGWSRHDTDGLFEDVCVITEGDEDAVYLVVKRTINGVEQRLVERFAGRILAGDVTASFFVDCGLSYNGSPATQFSGLDHLEGKTVSILADGSVHGQRVVSNGAVTLDYAASVVHIGLPYVAALETLDVSVSQSDVIGKRKLVNQVNVLVQESVGLMAGPDVTRLTPHRQRALENYGQAIQPASAQVQVKIQSTWSTGGNVVIRQDQPLPITILAVIPSVTSGGI